MNNRKQVKPRQNGMFNRFTLLVVDFFKERFVWTRRKPDTTDTDHDKRIAENYVFDEVLGSYVPRSEHEKRVKFSSIQKPPREECYGTGSDSSETVRFPSRLKQAKSDVDKNIDFTPAIPPTQNRRSISHFQPSRYHGKT